MIDLEILDRLPKEPFKVVHNDEPGLGAFVQVTPDSLTFWNGSKTVEIDETYEVVEEPGVFAFTSSDYESSIEISALSNDDRELLTDADDIESIDDLKARALSALSALLPGSDQVEETSAVTAAANELDLGLLESEGIKPTLAFTISDEGEVLELIHSNEDGVFVRESGKWTKIDPTVDQPTIDDLEWLDVREEAVLFWDNSESSDGSITVDDARKYAVPSE